MYEVNGQDGTHLVASAPWVLPFLGSASEIFLSPDMKKKATICLHAFKLLYTWPVCVRGWVLFTKADFLDESSSRGGELGTSYSSSNCHQLPCCIFLNFINSLKSLPFQT